MKVFTRKEARVLMGGDIFIPFFYTHIEEKAFYKRKNITGVTLSSSINSIGDYAFWGCKNLRSISIHSSVKWIGKNVFDGCDELRVECTRDSTAHHYCRENKINVKLRPNMFNRVLQVITLDKNENEYGYEYEDWQDYEDDD